MRLLVLIRMNDHKRKGISTKYKIAALPLVAAKFNGELKSSVEEDIKFYGILPLGQLTRDQNLFKPGSPVSARVQIIPVGDANPTNITWSLCFYDIHKKLLSELVNFVSRQGLGNVHQFGILCVGYEQKGKFDMQLGVTGGIDVGEEAAAARDREILEETGQATTWSWGRSCRDTQRKRWGQIDWTGYIVGLGGTDSIWSRYHIARWNQGCVCSLEAIDDGWECCASGFGKCSPQDYEMGDMMKSSN